MNRKLGLALLACATVAGCGSASNGGFPTGDSGSDASHDGTLSHGDAPVLTMHLDGPANEGTLTLSPSMATLNVTGAAPTPSEAFTATLTSGTSHQTVNATWSLSDYAIGTISDSGTFQAAGTVAGLVTVTGTYGSLTATAKISVTVNLTSNLTDVTLPDGTIITQDATAITPADVTALGGALSLQDSGTPTTLLYPYDQTVFPLGLLAPVVQFTSGSIAPVDFKVTVSTTGFHWDGLGHVGNPAALQAAIPQAIWDGALQTAAAVGPSTQVTLSVTKAANGIAYGPPASSSLLVANGKLTGVIYYESYSTDPIDGGADAPGDTDFGLWAVKPGQVTPPNHLQLGCVNCHSASAAGNILTDGTEDPTLGASAGVFRVEEDGGYTHLATAPTSLPYVVTGNQDGGVDSRGLGWATVSPDGKVILRSTTWFWGDEPLLAWATPNEPLLEGGVVQPLSAALAVEGGFNMFVPQYSVDGKRLVYVTSRGVANGGSAGTPSESIGFVDVATVLNDGGTSAGSITLSPPQLVYDSTLLSPDSGAAGTLTKVPTFLPDSETILFQETHVGPASEAAGYNGMLPDYDGVDGELAMLQKTTSGSYVRVPMKNANTAVDPNGATGNYEPKPLPVSIGGYYWVVFASTRKDAYPSVTSPKKIWVTAVSPGAPIGADSSHPPFTLVNQAIVSAQQSQRAYWALSPCFGVGASCQTGIDCCNGSCIPKSSTDPTSPLVCRTPTASTCVPLGGRCVAGQSQDCCNTSSNVVCIGTLNGYGTCETPGAPQ